MPEQRDLDPIRPPAPLSDAPGRTKKIVTGRADAFDSLIAAIGAALEADRTLGGLCDWVEPEAPASVDLPIEGAAALKAAVITVVLHYTTTGPLA